MRTAQRSFRVPPQAGFRVRRGWETQRVGADFPSARELARRSGKGIRANRRQGDSRPRRFSWSRVAPPSEKISPSRKKVLTPLPASVKMIAFLRGIRPIRRGRGSSAKLRFQPDFMGSERISVGLVRPLCAPASRKTAERFEITMVAADHVNFEATGGLERGLGSFGPASGRVAVMTDCGVGHGGNGVAQGGLMTPPAGSLAPAGGGRNEDRKVIGTVTSR